MRILVIEDEASLRNEVLAVLGAEGFAPRGVEPSRANLALALDERPSLVIVGQGTLGDGGVPAIDAVHARARTAGVALLVLGGDTLPVGERRATFVPKPVAAAALIALVRAQLPQLDPSRAPSLRRTNGESAGLIVREPAMRRVLEQAFRAAASRIGVLILGETGVGKEVLANAIHHASPRAHKPFLPLNCGALTETLLESELFGHERGAFTGAVCGREGLLEAADGGTVFLDEVGELPTPTQVKLLRVLEDQRVMRVGARSSKPIDVRFIAATNRDLAAATRSGAFRTDLFYRLNAFTLTVPPLRERQSEIVELATAFIASAASAGGRPYPPELSREAAIALDEHSWPGNVRELRNVMERAVVLCDGVVLPEHLPTSVTTRAAESQAQPPQSDRTVPVLEPQSPRPRGMLRMGIQALFDEGHGDVLAAVEEEALLVARDQGGNLTQAAKLLGRPRKTIADMIAKMTASGDRRRR